MAERGDASGVMDGGRRARWAWGAALVGGLAVAAWSATRAPTSMDYWWLLAEGRRLAAQGWAALDGAHPFVFTAPEGSRFHDKEWLFAWGLWQLVHLFGHLGPVVARALVVGVTTALFFRLAWVLGAWRADGGGAPPPGAGDASAPRGASPLTTALLFAIGASTVLVSRAGIRPHVVGFALLLGLLNLLAARATRGRLVAVLALMIVWINIHGSFALGLGVLGWALVWPRAAGWLSRRGGRWAPLAAESDGWGRFAWVALLLPLLTLANPYGVGLWGALRVFGEEIAGQFDPVVMPEWLPFSIDGPHGLFAVLLAGLFAVSWLLPGNRRGLLLGWAALGLWPAFTAQRFTADAFLAVGPLLAAQLGALGSLPRRTLQGGLAALAALSLVMMVDGSPPWRALPDEQALGAPVLAPLVEEQGWHPRVFTTLEASGYLLGVAGDRARVAYDGHILTPGFFAWSRAFKAAVLAPAAFDAYCADHGCDAVLLDLRDPVSLTLAGHLLTAPGWAPLPFTLRWGVYVRPAAVPPRVGARALERLRPFYVYDWLSTDGATDAAVARDLARLDPVDPVTAAAIRAFLTLRRRGLLGPTAPLAAPADAPAVRAALGALEAATLEAPWHQGMHFYAGAAAASLGEVRVAVEHLSEASRLSPAWVPPRVALIRVLRGAGLEARAAEELEALRRTSPAGAQAARRLGGG